MGRRPPTASTSRESPTLQPPREARTPKPERQAAVAARKKEEERQQAQRSKRKANANGSRNEQERKKPKLEVEAPGALIVREYIRPSPKNKSKSKQANTSVPEERPNSSSLHVRKSSAAKSSKEPSGRRVKAIAPNPNAPASKPAPPQPSSGPRRPNVKPPPTLKKVDLAKAGDINGEQLVERLHLREFIVRFAALLYSPLLDIEKSIKSRKRATRQQNRIPQWLVDAAGSPLNGFWHDARATSSFLLAVLTMLENEMFDAKLSYGLPLLHGGVSNYRLFQELLQSLDDIDLESATQAEEETSKCWLAAHQLLQNEGFSSELPFQDILVAPDVLYANHSGESRNQENAAASDTGIEAEVSRSLRDRRGRQVVQKQPQPSDSEPSSSEDEEESDTQQDRDDSSASALEILIDPDLLKPARRSEAKHATGSSDEDENDHESSSEEEEEESDASESVDSSEESGSGQDDTRHRRSQRIRKIEKGQHQAQQVEQKTRLRQRHHYGRVTRAIASGLSSASASSNSQSDGEGDEEEIPKRILKPQPKRPHRSHETDLLERFNPNRPIAEAERVDVITRYVDLIISRSDDFRDAIQTNIEKQKAARMAMQKAAKDFSAATKEHKSDKPQDPARLVKWTQRGDQLLCQHREALARLVPDTLLSPRFQWVEALAYSLFIPTLLPGATFSDNGSGTLSTVLLVHGPTGDHAVDGSSLLSSSSGPDLIRKPAQAFSRMAFFQLETAEQVRSFVDFLEGQCKLLAWEAKTAATPTQQRDLAESDQRVSVDLRALCPFLQFALKDYKPLFPVD